MDQDKEVPGIEDKVEQDALETISKELLDSDKLQNRELRGKFKKHVMFWHGFQKMIQDEISKDWVTPEGFLKSHRDMEFSDAMLDRPINVYRAHGESIISALSTGLPFVRFFPDDADSSADLNTAKAASKIAELVQLQNQAQLKFIYALFLMYNQGLVFAYTYHDEDEKYGIIEKQVQKSRTEQIPQEVCPVCSYPMEEGEILCQECGQEIPPDQKIVQNLEMEVPFFETVSEPKSQEKIELFGPLNVRVPSYVRNLKDSPYLCLEIEQHISLVREVYPDFFEEIESSGSFSHGYDRQFREKMIEDNKDIVTVRKLWLRPFAFNIFGTDEEKQDIIAALKVKYKSGVCVTFIDDRLVDAYEDDMDDHWTATESPLDSRIHADPLGSSLIPLQEIRTEFVELIVETAEQGIPKTFADPNILNFEAYQNQENAVGMVYPAVPRPGSNLANGFHTLHTATLSKETRDFVSALDQDAQFVGGAFPSVFGGMIKGGSQTAAEYEMSRNQALQRLSTAWKVINSWWAKVMFKCVKSYIDNVQDDEKIVKTSGDSFINTWIRTSELAGKLGGAEAETSEQFPVSWVQKRGMLLELMNLRNPMIDQAIYDPENSNTVSRTLGMPDFKIPGEADRDKQLAEIAELLKGESYEEPVLDPITGLPAFDPMTGMMVPPKIRSSVPIDPNVDLHPVHIQTCKAWAVSTVGRATKIENPAGYDNVIAHMLEHDEFMMMTMPPPLPEGEVEGETQPSKKENVNA